MKVGMFDIDIHLSSHLKEELAWAVDKWFWVTVYCKSFEGEKLRGFHGSIGAAKLFQ